MRKNWFGGLTALLGVFLLTVAVAPAFAQVSGKNRVILMNGNYLDGDVKEVKDGYEVKSKQGIISSIKKNDVREIVPLDAAGKPIDKKARPTDKNSGSANKSGVTGVKNDAAAPAQREVSDAEIAFILGDGGEEDAAVAADADPDESASGDPKDLPDLPLDKDSLQQMLRIANTNNYLERPHFALIYTSSKTEAEKLASGLERTYSGVHKFMKLLDLKPAKPQSKLEVYYFNTHKEYESYGSTVEGVPSWALGFYKQDINRSAFYDLNDYPEFAQLREQLKQLPPEDWRAKQFINNRIKSTSNYYNLTVIQHEAAHHIHFNVGIFNRRGHYPTWIVEGLAQMFELPPGEAGGGIGATNYVRLAEFNKQYRPNKGSITATRLFVADNDQWNPEKYSHGWALVHYLYKKKRDQFAKYMHKMAAREDDRRLNETEQQQEFEDVFGPADEKFHEDFVKFIFDIPNRPSVLP